MYTHISPAIAVLKAEAVVASYKVLINDRNNGLRTIIITIGPIIFRKGKCNDKKASQCNVTKCVYKVMIDVMVNLEIVTIDIPPQHIRLKAYPPPIVGTKLQINFTKYQ